MREVVWFFTILGFVLLGLYFFVYIPDMKEGAHECESYGGWRTSANGHIYCRDGTVLHQ